MESQDRFPENTVEQAAVFSALADPTRLKLLKLLCAQCAPDALCVNALAGLLGVTQSAVSQHLRVLKANGLVKGERRGYHIHYFVNGDKLEKCRDLISAALTAGVPGENPTCQKYCPKKNKQTSEERIAELGEGG
ncbi:MAG TPA: metalloregulator ArsR/SmtB family transcription factor [Dehalococcoidia bacterium]|jgi:DNA-binding transcriptional ArsR family regulator